MRRTLLLTLVLGISAAAVTSWVDLNREKDAVETLANSFLDSAVPAVSAAVYNFDQDAAEQSAKGLFLKRAIVGVTIVNEGAMMVDERRSKSRTLPQIGEISSAEEIFLSEQLYAPSDSEQMAPIGEISIVVDRSLVAPEIVDRLVTFFFVTSAKNFVFGMLLYLMIFRVLARHISALADAVNAWNPGVAEFAAPKPPGLVENTEVERLGLHLERLTKAASGTIRDIQVSHDAVVDDNAALAKQSEELSDTVRNRTFELEKANKRLKRMADYDGLTGLLNRASFDRLLGDAFNSQAPAEAQLAVLLIDVDHFKAYNDFYGHQSGDKTLKSLAEILSSVADATGCIVARYGGEEFAAIVSEKGLDPAHIAQRIHVTLQRTDIEHQHSAVARQITVSIGSASTAAGERYSDPEKLIQAADDALYQAKRNGRNQTVVSTREIRAQAARERLSMQALLDAIEAEEFEPYVQPQVDARTGALTGAEALVRWVRPDGTVVPPGDFMQLATKTGLIRKIDAIVLKKITSFLSSHPGILPRLSFNVTGESFDDNAYVDGIVTLAKSTTTGITVELLETAFIDQPSEHFLWQLDLIREAGVEIEIDDFGTGRTSILGLISINPDRLKIARELILPIGIRSEQLKLVTSVIEIAQSLSVDVLAEGVETQEAAEVLVEIGCPMQQGYFHGRPMPFHSLLSVVGDRVAASK